MTSPSSSASASASHVRSRRNFLRRSATSPASPARPRPRYASISRFPLSGSLPSVEAHAAYSSMVMGSRSVGFSLGDMATRSYFWVPHLRPLRSAVRDTRVGAASTSLQRLQKPLHQQRARLDRGDERVLPAGMRAVAVDAEPVERRHSERGGEIAVAAAPGRGGFFWIEAELPREPSRGMEQPRARRRLLERRAVPPARHAR